MCDRGVLLLLYFSTCTSREVLSLMIGSYSVLWLGCPLGAHMDTSWWEIAQLSCCHLVLQSSSLLMMLRSMLHPMTDWKQWPLPFVCVVRGWGLTVTLVKSKSMVAGIEADTWVLAQILVEGGVMELVESFQYLCSIISSNEELSGQLAKAAKKDAFITLSLFISHCLMRLVDVSTLLLLWPPCSETWAVKADQM